ncbi:MAG: hypothetical protein WC764_00940 [Candidatus Paceibacterota bacterium]|jgi:hypothetical protein
MHAIRIIIATFLVAGLVFGSFGCGAGVNGMGFDPTPATAKDVVKARAANTATAASRDLPPTPTTTAVPVSSGMIDTHGVNVMSDHSAVGWVRVVFPAQPEEMPAIEQLANVTVRLNGQDYTNMFVSSNNNGYGSVTIDGLSPDTAYVVQWEVSGMTAVDPFRTPAPLQERIDRATRLVNMSDTWARMGAQIATTSVFKRHVLTGPLDYFERVLEAEKILDEVLDSAPDVNGALDTEIAKKLVAALQMGGGPRSGIYQLCQFAEGWDRGQDFGTEHDVVIDGEQDVLAAMLALQAPARVPAAIEKLKAPARKLKAQPRPLTPEQETKLLKKFPFLAGLKKKLDASKVESVANKMTAGEAVIVLIGASIRQGYDQLYRQNYPVLFGYGGFEGWSYMDRLDLTRWSLEDLLDKEEAIVVLSMSDMLNAVEKESLKSAIKDWRFSVARYRKALKSFLRNMGDDRMDKADNLIDKLRQQYFPGWFNSSEKGKN